MSGDSSNNCDDNNYVGIDENNSHDNYGINSNNDSNQNNYIISNNTAITVDFIKSYCRRTFFRNISSKTFILK